MIILLCLCTILSGEHIVVIKTIDVKQYSVSHLTCTTDRMFHKKSLRFLSVVQALEGTYGIGIDTSEEQQTGSMGAFIAPKGKMQYITHYVNPETGIMRAHWIFLDIVINGMFHIDDIFDFPVLLPKQYNREVHDIIIGVQNNDNLCVNLSDIYKLIKILLHIGIPRSTSNQEMNQIRYYINQHYAEKITPYQLAQRFTLSVPTLFRKFSKSMGLSPSNYINSVRLEQASFLLETTDHTIGQVSIMVGFEDAFYFSKLFKKKYGISPLNYRKKVRD